VLPRATTSLLPTDAKNEKPIATGVGELAQAYMGNEASADMRFTGKLVELTVQGNIQKNEQGQYYIAVAGIRGEFGRVGPLIVCRILPSENVKLATAENTDFNGPAFKVTGICRGLNGDRVLVVNCTAEPIPNYLQNKKK
jgi:hypothetical protein